MLFDGWLGDLHRVEGLPRELAGLVAVLASAACGALIGLERERRDKPAGLRTVVLIALGSTIFTLVSLLLGATKGTADPARLASQIVPGIGFLGAGAILRSGGHVRGLTTGATIWAVAAVGVAIGAGYVAAGVVFTVLILFTLTVLHRVESLVNGRCVWSTVRVVYDPDSGKTLPRLREVLDRYRVPDDLVAVDDGPGAGPALSARVCTHHRDHRAVLKDLADAPHVRALEVRPA